MNSRSQMWSGSNVRNVQQQPLNIYRLNTCCALTTSIIKTIRFYKTSNVTGRHRGPKHKLRAGYRAPSLKRTSCCDYFSLLHVVSSAFSVLCVYSKFGHQAHPLCYPCAKFCFFHDLHCCASPWWKITYSFTHSPSLLHAPGTEACAYKTMHTSSFCGTKVLSVSR